MRSENSGQGESAAGSDTPNMDAWIEMETGQAGEPVPPGVMGGDARDSPAREGETAEMEALRERYLRLAAEYDNYRKRTDRERLESRDRAQSLLLERLLESLDDLQRVTALQPEGTNVDALLEGIRMVERKLLRTLEAEGLERLEARGQPFDPNVHEALMTAPTAEPSEDHTVGEVFQDGYLFRGTLLRPARVQVRRHEG